MVSSTALSKMRKQYHLRPSERGLLAWDVDRLIELTADLPRHEVPLSAIHEFDEEYWFGSVGDRPTCRAVAEHARLIAATDLRYPIILSADGRVMDGMHRVAKGFLEGRECSAHSPGFTPTNVRGWFPRRRHGGPAPGPVHQTAPPPVRDGSSWWV